MIGLSVSQEAVADLRAIWAFVARESEASADRLVDEIYSAFELLQRMPLAGHHHQMSTDEETLCWNVRGEWLIFYRHDEDTLNVGRVVWGRRDLRRL